MREIMNEIREKFNVDGEDERYATLYESKQDIVDQGVEIEVFEDTYSVNADELNYPVIGFDSSKTDDGWLYEKDHDKEYILSDAESYFSKKE